MRRRWFAGVAVGILVGLGTVMEIDAARGTGGPRMYMQEARQLIAGGIRADRSEFDRGQVVGRSIPPAIVLLIDGLYARLVAHFAHQIDQRLVVGHQVTANLWMNAGEPPAGLFDVR